MIRRRNRIYRKEGRSATWKRLKKVTDEMIRKRKRHYMDLKKQQLTESDANRSFFRLVKSFNTAEKPQNFDVRSLRPGKSDLEVAEELASFFNRISAEFDPLSPGQIPSTEQRALPVLSPAEVSRRIKFFKKPKSMVRGDILPALLTKYCDFFAMPLADIYNEVIKTFIWPTSWKAEYVTVIPKNSSPNDFGDLRNISCTMLVSKILESYVLEWALEEVSTKRNQYGGVKGCSGTHMIIKIWQKILTNLEDRRTATILTSIDYAKAFNRLSFQHCLTSFAKKGATTPILKLIATFLTNRSMQVRVGSTWSSPRAVTGGCPQGSILGVLLFNITTDDLEEDSPYVAKNDDEEITDEEDEVGGSDDSFFNAAPDDSFDSDADYPLQPPLEQTDSFHDAVSVQDGSFASARSDVSGNSLDGCSTPAPGAVPLELPSISPVRSGFVFDIRLNGRSDYGQRLARRIIYSSEEDVTPPPEPTATCLGNWVPRQVEVDKYVDDNVQEESANFENCLLYTSPSPRDRQKYRMPSSA